VAAPRSYRGKKRPPADANPLMRALEAYARPAMPGESDTWLRRLRGPAAERDAAVAELHALLLRAARHELRRRPSVTVFERDDLAHQAAADALVAVLAKLDDFRGVSRFTTWAYKFALLEAGVRVRRRAWQQREVVLDSNSWAQLAEAAAGPDVDAERGELLRSLSDCIHDDLTSHQRRVLVSLAIDGVPLDVLAERLNTTRGALYKTLHDARRKLRTALDARGFPVEEI
jgi:RNA polymerase sigma-70 factor, ECF subfamily